MRWWQTVGSEVFGLFVDDGSFALAVLAWVAVAWLVTPRLGPGWQGVLLVGGLVVILCESAVRAAGRLRRP